MNFQGAAVLVVGMERSGIGSVRLLLEQGARVRGTDQKPLGELPRAAEFLRARPVEFRVQSPEVFEGVDCIVVSPGVPADLPELDAARRRGVPVIGEVELAGYFLRGPVIGITGSNGKTTTTSLVGHILREAGVAVQVGGNIGTAITTLIDSSRSEQWNVLELSSFQLETIGQFRAHIAVAVNVTPDHLDRHGTFERYAAAKRRLFETQNEDDYAVLNADDATCVAYAGSNRARPVWFSAERPVTPGVWRDNGRLVFDGTPFLEVCDIPLRGRHNVENVMAAAAATRLAGAGLEQVAAAVRSFSGVEHRLEFVRQVGGVSYYNDSKATNVDATRKAIDAFDGGLWVILGGKDKGSDYTPLREPLLRTARAALLIGAAAEKIAGQLGDAVPLVQAGTLEEAVRTAYHRAQGGETVLLAPACASFDQFENFEHRGRVFKALVNQLEEKPA